nr:hypothetical protein [Tanacetum cinerariifolium]
MMRLKRQLISKLELLLDSSLARIRSKSQRRSMAMLPGLANVVKSHRVVLLDLMVIGVVLCNPPLRVRGRIGVSRFLEEVPPKSKDDMPPRNKSIIALNKQTCIFIRLIMYPISNDDEDENTVSVEVGVAYRFKPSKNKNSKSNKIDGDATGGSRVRARKIMLIFPLHFCKYLNFVSLIVSSDQLGQCSQVAQGGAPRLHGDGSGVVQPASQGKTQVTPKDHALLFQTNLGVSDACTMRSSTKSYVES